ncbi:MAG: hypothetical protein HN685_00215, partial [Waddliaceae bacterium]|nr:hypothetical protein [Waddliaceae bacterium]
FLLTPKWDNAVTAYCEDSVAAESLRDGIVKDFKFFIAKKYKKALARRYETLMSRKEEEVDSPPKIAALRDAIEESLRLHLTGLLDIEEQHEEDLSTIAEAEKAERPQKQLLGIASDVGGLFLKSSE